MAKRFERPNHKLHVSDEYGELVDVFDRVEKFGSISEQFSEALWHLKFEKVWSDRLITLLYKEAGLDRNDFDDDRRIDELWDEAARATECELGFDYDGAPVVRARKKKA